MTSCYGPEVVVHVEGFDAGSFVGKYLYFLFLISADISPLSFGIPGLSLEDIFPVLNDVPTR